MLPFEGGSVELTERQDTALVFTPGTKLSDIERVVILETLRAQNFNRTHAARVLGIGIRTLQRKLKKYGASHLGLNQTVSQRLDYSQAAN